MKEIIDYIKTFLTYGNAAGARAIGYTADAEEWYKYKVVIVPNGHLGNDLVLPFMGNVSATEHVNGEKKTFVIADDIIYTCFFFISRAEELMVAERDEHGRFAAKNSILGEHNRLQIPLLDEYARSVMKMLELPLPKSDYAHIYLTHDIDTIAQYRHLRGFIGGWLRDGMDPVLDAVEDIKNDPAYTFPWLVKQDKRIANAEVIYFVKDTPGKGYDYPQYKLHGMDWTRLYKYLKSKKVQFGLHSSYYGTLPSRRLRTIDYRMHRSHYLRCSIDQMQALADAGFTDDFTMGFADQAGFRLQTTRAVRWINPKTMELTNMTLHPLMVMDCTLSNANYMGLTEDEAYYFCQRLFEKVRQHNGDLCLLWHNSILNSKTYHKELYSEILTHIING